MNEIEKILRHYIESARRYAKATEKGDYRACNNNYRIIKKCESLLHNSNRMIMLERFIDDPNPGVRIWVAYDLLPLIPQKSMAVLEEISNGDYGIHCLDAKMTLKQWKKGTLVFPYISKS